MRTDGAQRCVSFRRAFQSTTLLHHMTTRRSKSVVCLFLSVATASCETVRLKPPTPTQHQCVKAGYCYTGYSRCRCSVSISLARRRRSPVHSAPSAQAIPAQRTRVPDRADPDPLRSTLGTRVRRNHHQQRRHRDNSRAVLFLVPADVTGWE